MFKDRLVGRIDKSLRVGKKIYDAPQMDAIDFTITHRILEGSEGNDVPPGGNEGGGDNPSGPSF